MPSRSKVCTANRRRVVLKAATSLSSSSSRARRPTSRPPVWTATSTSTAATIKVTSQFFCHNTVPFNGIPGRHFTQRSLHLVLGYNWVRGIHYGAEMLALIDFRRHASSVVDEGSDTCLCPKTKLRAVATRPKPFNQLLLIWARSMSGWEGQHE